MQGSTARDVSLADSVTMTESNPQLWMRSLAYCDRCRIIRWSPQPNSVDVNSDINLCPHRVWYDHVPYVCFSAACAFLVHSSTAKLSSLPNLETYTKKKETCIIGKVFFDPQCFSARTVTENKWIAAKPKFATTYSTYSLYYIEQPQICAWTPDFSGQPRSQNLQTGDRWWGLKTVFVSRV